MPTPPRQRHFRSPDRPCAQLACRHGAVLERLDLALLTTDSDGQVSWLNPAASQLIGMPAHELIDKRNLFSLVVPDEVAIHNGGTPPSSFAELVASLPQGPGIRGMLTGRSSRSPLIPFTLSALPTCPENDPDVQGDRGYLISLDTTDTAARRFGLDRRQDALFSHITNGISAVTGEAFFDTLATELAKALKVDYAFLGERLGDGQQIRMMAIRSPDGIASVFDYEVAHTASQRVLNNGFCLYARDVQKHFPDDDRLKNSGIQGYAGIELAGSNGQSLGLMAILHSQPIEEPQLAEYLLRIFASRAASELERQIQQQQLQKSRTDLIQRNKNLKLINSLSLQLHGSRSIDAIVQETLDAIVTLSQSPHVAFYLKGPEPWLTLADARGFDDELRRIGQTLPIENSLSARAIETQEVAIANDLASDPHMDPAVRDGLVGQGFVSGAIIPLIFDEQLIGTVNIMDRIRQHRSEDERRTLAALGHTVSLALSNIRRTRELTHLAEHDSLTDLPNRLMLHRMLDGLNAADEGSAVSTQSALMLLDLDRFKEINDTLGHHIGDQLLQKIGPRLRDALSDARHALCRLGGDEFAVLITDLNDEIEAVHWAGEILAAMRQPHQVDHMVLEIGVSIGLVIHPEDHRDKHELLRMADVAMYTAKRRGGGVARYDRERDLNTPDKLGLLSELGAAIREDGLVLHFQPKLGLEHREIIGFEALVRWTHPQRGLLFPDSFMPQAEVSEVIHRLTEAVLNLALRQQQRWRLEGRHHAIAINLSARNLIDDRCLDMLKTILRQYGSNPNMIELEITETALMHDPEGAALLLRNLSDLGIRLSIDDFGTGYSSLGYLRHLPIHHLKIDRTFVKDMLNNAQDAIIVRSTIGLAHNLGLQVIAEGVEDEKTLDALQAMRCDAAQGYYIGRPKPAEAWTE